MTDFPSNVRLAEAMRGGYSVRPSSGGFDVDYGTTKSHWVQAKDYDAVCALLNAVPGRSDARAIQPQRPEASAALKAFLIFAADTRSQSSGFERGRG